MEPQPVQLPAAAQPGCLVNVQEGRCHRKGVPQGQRMAVEVSVHARMCTYTNTWRGFR